MSSASALYVANQLATFRSDDHSILLKPFSLAIHRGEWISIIGHNGSGKSTLATFISGLQRGGIVVEGEEQRQADMVFPIVTQMTSHYLLGSTAYEDMMISYEQYGMPLDKNRLETKIDELLAELQLLPLKHVPIESLSGGERQLVAIAGALLMDTSCIILDEITSMLSEDNKWRVVSIIRKLAKQQGIAVLSITQQLDELEVDDTIWVLQELKLVYQGTAAGLYGSESETRGQASLQHSKAVELGLPIPWSVRKSYELGLAAEQLQFNPYDLARMVKQKHAITT